MTVTEQSDRLVFISTVSIFIYINTKTVPFAIEILVMLWVQCVSMPTTQRGSLGRVDLRHRGMRMQSIVPKSHAMIMTQEIISHLAEVGDVEAPNGALVVAAIGVSAAVLLVPFLLRPGIDAAEKMQERDAKSGRWRK